MLVSDIHPFASYSGRTTFSPGHMDPFDDSKLSDHDIQLAAQGRGALLIDGIEYPMEKGDVIIIFPGESFMVRADGDEPFSRYFIHFDFYREPEHRLATPVLDDGSCWPRTVRLSHYVDARAKCANIVLRKLKNEPISQVIADGELLSFLGLVIEQHNNSTTQADPEFTKSRRNIMRAERFVRENYARDISVKDIADVAGLSANYFGNTFKSILGTTPLGYLTDYRIEQAKRLMVDTEHTVGEIAQMVGYDDIHYFSNLFKRREGISPSGFIARFTTDEK